MENRVEQMKVEMYLWEILPFINVFVPLIVSVNICECMSKAQFQFNTNLSKL